MSGPTAVVTGASGGIGHAIVETLAGEGYRVVAADLRLPDPDHRIAGVDYRTVDLREPDDIERLAAAVPDGRLDCLVNAAGVALFDDDGSVFEIEERIWELTMRVNLDGMRLMTRAMLPLLREGGRKSIVNIASTAGLRNMDSPLDAYQVSKAAVVSLSRAMAIQLGPEGIRCNTVCPGATLTPMIAHLYERSPERRVDMEQRTPLRRLGLPQDMADAVSFLCSDRASFITAADLVVDGGWTAQIK